MIKYYIKFSQKPSNLIFQIIVFFILIPILISYMLGEDIKEKFIYLEFMQLQILSKFINSSKKN